MKKNYTIDVTRFTQSSGTFEIEADDEFLAIEEAEEQFDWDWKRSKVLETTSKVLGVSEIGEAEEGDD